MHLGPATYRLTIADDGVGLPQDFDPSRSRSLGMTLLYGFSGQLGGELSIDNQQGLNISLVFVEELFSLPQEPLTEDLTEQAGY